MRTAHAAVLIGNGDGVEVHLSMSSREKACIALVRQILALVQKKVENADSVVFC